MRKIRIDQIERLDLDDFIVSPGDTMTGPLAFDTTDQAQYQAIQNPGKTLFIPSNQGLGFAIFEFTQSLSTFINTNFIIDIQLMHNNLTHCNIQIRFNTDNKGLPVKSFIDARCYQSHLDYKEDEIVVGIEDKNRNLFIGIATKDVVGYSNKGTYATISKLQVNKANNFINFSMIEYTTTNVRSISNNWFKSQIFNGSDRELLRKISEIRANFFYSKKDVKYRYADIDKPNNQPLVRVHIPRIQLSYARLLRFVDNSAFDIIIERYRPQAITSSIGQPLSFRDAGFALDQNPGRQNRIKNIICILTAPNLSPAAFLMSGHPLEFSQENYFKWIVGTDINGLQINIPKGTGTNRYTSQQKNAKGSVVKGRAFIWLGFKLNFTINGVEYTTRTHIGYLKVKANSDNSVLKIFDNNNPPPNSLFNYSSGVISYHRG